MPEFFGNFIENKIREAEEKGTFRNLPGQGKPLQLDDDRSDPRFWLAHHLLKSAGLVPSWVELAKEIDGFEDRIAATETEFSAWLAAETDHLSDIKAADLRRRLPGIRAIYIRFIDRYFDLLRQTQERKQRFNYEAPARSLEKWWPPVESRVRDFQDRFRQLLAERDPALLDDAEIAAAVALPASIAEHFDRSPKRAFNSSGQTLMAGATRAALRENLLRKISDAAALVIVNRPNGGSGA